MAGNIIITCPKCGEDFELTPSKEVTVQCPHCSKKVVVPAEYRKKGGFSGVIALLLVLALLGGGGGYYILTVRKAEAERKARQAAERRRRIEEEEAALAEKAKAWTKVLDATSEEFLKKESDFDRAIEVLKAYQEKYPNEVAQPAVVKEKVMRLRQAASDGVMRELREKAAPLLAKGEFAEAADLYLNYSGNFAKDTRERRMEIAGRHRAKAEELLREEREKKRKALERKRALLKKIADEMTKQRYGEALKALRASGDDTLKDVDSALVALSRISVSVFRSFKADEGKRIVLKLRSGKVKARIAKVGDNHLVVKVAKRGATLSKKITIKELDYDEIAKRLSASNKIAGAFFKGIVAMKKREYSLAEDAFNEAGPLASDLLAYLHSMKDIATKNREKKPKVGKRDSLKKINYNAIAIEAKVSTLKKATISGAGKKRTFKARISVRNMTGADLEECQLEMLIIGENALRKRVFKIIERKNFDLDLKKSKTMKTEFEFSTVYYKDRDWSEWAEDSNQKNVGYKYVNWICVVMDLKNDIKKIKTRNKTFSKIAAKIVKMADDTVFDKNGRPLSD